HYPPCARYVLGLGRNSARVIPPVKIAIASGMCKRHDCQRPQCPIGEDDA
ncbi:MAG: hypothetical protein GQ539_18255, partial [Sulfitobacter sp.]|nr:hypothetical protein [Sulfitobacter sp.]